MTTDPKSAVRFENEHGVTYRNEHGEDCVMITLEHYRELADSHPVPSAASGLAEEIQKVIDDKSEHIKMMSGGPIAGIKVALLEQAVAALRSHQAPVGEDVAYWEHVGRRAISSLRSFDDKLADHILASGKTPSPQTGGGS